MRAVQAAIYMPRRAKRFGNSSVPISQNEEPFRTEHLYTAISRKIVGKSARDNPERYCGWFSVQCSSKQFERMAQEAMDVFATAKGSNKSRFD